MVGGLHFDLSKKWGHDLKLESGLFEENTADYSGGAIDCSIHGQPVLELKNALMMGNSAPNGGGVWACPSARVTSHSTLGGIILDNKRTSDYGKGGDIRFLGSDSYYALAEGNDPNFNTMTVLRRTFLGDKINWYADPKTPGNPILDPKDYTDRATSFGLVGKLAEKKEWYETYKELANLLFINNSASVRGGAIATNNELQIGLKEDLALQVTKTWKDPNKSPIDNPPLKSIKVKLIRKDSTGQSYDLETIDLSKDNNWTYTFKDLPSKGLIDGREVPFTYEVKEVTPLEGYKVIYYKTDQGIEIVNEKEEVKEEKTKVSVHKVWRDQGNLDSKRPDSIKVELYANGQPTGKILELSEDNQWQGVFDQLDVLKNGEKISYSVSELTLAGYRVEITGNQEEGYTLINTPIPHNPGPGPEPEPKYTRIDGQKIWLGDKEEDRPEFITIRLYNAETRELVQEIQVTKASGWAFSFEHLLEKDESGKTYSYVVEEVVPEGYQVSYDGTKIINHYKPELPEKPGKPEEPKKPKEDQPIEEVKKQDQPKIEEQKRKTQKNVCPKTWKKAPQTGVDFPFLGYLLLTGLSGTGLLLVKKKED